MLLSCVFIASALLAAWHGFDAFLFHQWFWVWWDACIVWLSLIYSSVLMIAGWNDGRRKYE